MIYKLLLLFSLYLPFQLALNPAANIDLASGRVFIILLFLFWLISGLKNKRIFIHFKIQTLLILSFLFISVLSLVFSQNIGWSSRKILFLFSVFPLYFVASAVVRNEDGTEKIIRYLLWGAGAAAAAGIIQFSLQFIMGLDRAVELWKTIITPFLGQSFSRAVFENSSWLVGISGKNFFRATAFFPDPHMFSFYLGLALPWALSFYLSKRKKEYLFLFSIIFLADLLTFSRGGYLGIMIGFLFILFAFRERIMKINYSRKSAGIFLLVLIFGFAIFLNNPVIRRFSSSFDLSEGSNKGRIEIWKESLAVVKNNPFGAGIGNYALEIKPSASYREPIYAHNLYLDIAAETGLLNAFIFAGLILTSALSYWKKMKRNIFYLGGAISLIIFSAHSFFETPLFSSNVLPFLVIIIALSPNYYDKKHN